MIISVDVKTGEKTERLETAEEAQKRVESFESDSAIREKQNAINKLVELDMRSIRAIREGDTARIQALENEAVELRKKLKVS